MKKYLKYGIMGIVAVALSSLLFSPKQEKEPESTRRDYEEIVRSGVLRAVTEYNAISYHAEGDTVSGFHYELLQAFAKEKGLKVEVTPEMSIENRLHGIMQGKYDILANNVLITSDRKDTLLFTHPILLSKQVLVQRKARSEDDSIYINSHLELAGKTLHVVKGSPYMYRIHNLSNEIGDTIYIQEVEKYGPEQLLALVANGDIDYAVCDENIAEASIDSMPGLDIKTPISFNQFYSWGVSKDSPVLLDSLNHWIDRYKQTKAFKALLKKYHNN